MRTAAQIAEQDYQRKAKVLCDLVVATTNIEEWDAYKRAADLGISLAIADQGKLATIRASGKKYVIEAYGLLMDVLDIEDHGYTSISEVWDAANAVKAARSG
jgi:hypothetical protein